MPEEAKIQQNLFASVIIKAPIVIVDEIEYSVLTHPVSFTIGLMSESRKMTKRTQFEWANNCETSAKAKLVFSETGFAIGFKDVARSLRG